MKTIQFDDIVLWQGQRMRVLGHQKEATSDVYCIAPASGSVSQMSLIEAKELQRVPTIVCLCGSTRFSGAFQWANLHETLEGRIVLSIGCDTKADDTLFASYSEEQKAQIKEQLDLLHLAKIDLADEVLILNVNDYIGASTEREIAYAIQQGKRLRWLEGRCHQCESDERLQRCVICGNFCCWQHHSTTAATAFGELFQNCKGDIIECFECGCK